MHSNANSETLGLETSKHTYRTYIENRFVVLLFHDHVISYVFDIWLHLQTRFNILINLVNIFLRILYKVFNAAVSHVDAFYFRAKSRFSRWINNSYEQKYCDFSILICFQILIHMNHI